MNFDNSEHFTEFEDDESVRRRSMPERKNIFSAFNESVVRPFLVRKFTPQVIFLQVIYIFI